MAGLIRRNDIDEVRSRVNIADVVGEFVTLKSAGVGSMKGLCPFHDERSPSFHVRPQVGYYHCFGCGEGGDVFSFLQKVDHVTFSEAVERLAAGIGFELHYEDGGQASDHSNRARLLAANEAAREWFTEQLMTDGADAGRQFLGERGFDAAAAERFGVGYAPQGWDNLGKHLRSRGFTAEELSVAGLTSSGDRGSYDRFRGRLVWPIRDQTGQTVGFGARRLFDDDKGPKYLNTPETPVYHKSQVLYGLDLAKRDISRGRQVVVVEGYTDVMACHLAGVTTAVATCGTAFGVDHIKIIRRILGDDTSGLGEVVFTFDPDAAGQKAALRAFSEEQRFEAQTYVAVAPDGLDPCDLRLSRGDDAVRRLISSKKPMFEFAIRQKLLNYDLNTVEGRAAGLREAAPIVSDIRDPALRPGYTRELAGLLGIELDEATRAVEAARRREESGQRNAGSARVSTPSSSSPAGSGRPATADRGQTGSFDRAPMSAASRGQGDGSDRTQTGPQHSLGRPGQTLSGSAQPGSAQPGSAQPGSAQSGSAQPGSQRGSAHSADPVPAIPSVSLTQLPATTAVRLERDALMAMLQYPKVVGRELLARASVVGFSDASLAAVRSAIAASIDDYERADWVAVIAGAVAPQYVRLVEQLAVAPVPERPERELDVYLRRVTSSLIERHLVRRKAEVHGRLQRTDSTADPEAYRSLNRELMQLEAERRAIQAD
ncbi:DNA primase [Subtercola boreus]|uniref:DNA primase n=1 Tax=Subtercola boreus TaxID=120213 RepID=A0A3E0WAD8_9MICO|nr:DNA primase [Subtercola boreus]RFA20851.1 DNA primase [Subtercola boreus]RFA20968.1 DNA primase [Subtercola boreus]RFA27162.1 DNA primase [Subtercola boreus]